jgi:hypothetical protein
MLQSAVDGDADTAVRSTAMGAVNQLSEWLAEQSSPGRTMRGHYGLALFQIERMRADPGSVEELRAVSPPPGGPIGQEAYQ